MQQVAIGRKSDGLKNRRNTRKPLPCEITFDDSDKSLCLFEGVTVATNYLTITDASYAQDGTNPGFTGRCPGLPN